MGGLLRAAHGISKDHFRTTKHSNNKHLDTAVQTLSNGEWLSSKDPQDVIVTVKLPDDKTPATSTSTVK